MFATGSHDGGVRIWTSPVAMSLGPGSEEYLSVVSSRATTNPANTPRTMTPSPYDADYRTDSPVAQLSPDSQDGHASGNSSNGPVPGPSDTSKTSPPKDPPNGAATGTQPKSGR